MKVRQSLRCAVACAVVVAAALAFTGVALAGGAKPPYRAYGLVVASGAPSATGEDVVDPWTNVDVVTVFVSALSEDGLFDQVRFAVDDGEYGEWQTLTPEAEVQLPPLDGKHEIHIQLASSLMDPGEYGSVDDPVEVDVPTILDTVGPTTLAPDAIEALLGQSATIIFSVKDELSPKADVRVAVSYAKGEVVKTIALGRCRTGVRVTRQFTVGLPRGRYHYAVMATDLAGNPQQHTGRNRLVIR